MQWELQNESFGYDPPNLEGNDREYYVTFNAYGLEDELHEATNEISWKPWLNGKGHFNRTAYIGELVDAFHFLLNMLLAAGGRPEDIATEFTDRYVIKRAINAERQARGYDGRSDKCECGRAMEDGSLLEELKPRGEMFYRCVCGRENCLKMDTT